MSQKNSILDLVGVVDLPLSLPGEVFQRYLLVKHIGQLMTHSKIVKNAKSVLCRFIAC